MKSLDPELTLTPYWSHLQDVETRYVAGHKTILQQEIDTPSFSFLGFLYRGVVLQGSRRQTMVLSNAATTTLGTDSASAERFVDRLVDIYLSHYGSGTTINNLILETEHGLPEANAAESVHLSFGGGTSLISMKGTARCIVVSTPLAMTLGMELPLWSDIRTELLKAQDNEMPALKRSITERLRRADDLVAEAERVLVRNESEFLFSFGSYVLQDPTPPAHRIIEVLPTWLRAFQALFMFLIAFGRHWATYPVRPPFTARLQNIHLPVPNSAITAISSRLIEPGALKKVAEKINADYPTDLKSDIDRTVTLIAEFVQHDRERIRLSLSKVYPKWDEGDEPLPYEAVPHVASLLELAMKLIGAKHEGKQLSFIFLCASEASLLRYHIGATRRPWILRLKQILDPRDFPDIRDCSRDKLLEAIAFSIQANALLLQEPGHALYFRLIPGQFAPDSIVAFEPFDPRRLDARLQDFTAEDPYALAIHVRAREAKLFVKGEKKALSDGRTWETGTGLGGRKGSEPLVDSITDHPWGNKMEGVPLSRVRKVCKTILHVAERGYGALVFLVQDRKSAPKMSTMAPVWGSAEAGLLDDIDPETLCTLAGLDGETYVDVSTGRYFARQFLHVPQKRFLELFVPDGDGNMQLNPALARSWRIAIEPVNEVYGFGTRHQKALRITWAYSKTTIAITVSSNGPIRLWAGGIPVAKFAL